MKKSVFLFNLILFVILSQVVVAQQFKTPKDYSFETPESYHNYEKDIVKFVNWVTNKDVDQESANFKSAKIFFNEWLSGCNYVRFQENMRVESAFSDIPELNICYVAGWVKYALKHPDNFTRDFKIRCTIAGIEAMLEVYEDQYQTKKRNGDIEGLMKVYRQGKLLQWASERVD